MLSSYLWPSSCKSMCLHYVLILVDESCSAHFPLLKFHMIIKDDFDKEYG